MKKNILLVAAIVSLASCGSKTVIQEVQARGLSQQKFSSIIYQNQHDVQIVRRFRRIQSLPLAQ